MKLRGFLRKAMSSLSKPVLKVAAKQQDANKVDQLVLNQTESIKLPFEARTAAKGPISSQIMDEVKKGGAFEKTGLEGDVGRQTRHSASELVAPEAEMPVQHEGTPEARLPSPDSLGLFKSELAVEETIERLPGAQELEASALPKMSALSARTNSSNHELFSAEDEEQVEKLSKSLDSLSSTDTNAAHQNGSYREHHVLSAPNIKPSVETRSSMEIRSTSETEIVPYIQNQNASVRLTNALSVAQNLNKLPISTIEKYLTLTFSQRQAQFTRIANLGKKSFFELDALLVNVAKSSAANIIEQSSAKNFEKYDLAAIAKLTEGLQKIDLLDVLICARCSPRLTTLVNSLDKNTFGAKRSLGHFLYNFSAVEVEVKREQNIGKKTIQELSSKTQEVAASVFSILGYDRNMANLLSDAVHLKLPGNLDTKTLEVAATKVAESLEQNILNNMKIAHRLVLDFDAISDIHLRPKATFTRILHHTLSTRELEVIEYRYGLNNRTRSTLESTSKHYSVTRERIRQIEAKAIRNLQTPVFVDIFHSYLNARISEIWKILSFSGDLLTEPMIQGWRGKVSGQILLSADVVFGDIEQLLSEVGEKITLPNDQSIWLSKRINAEKCAEIIEELSARDTVDKSLAQRIKVAVLDGDWPIRLGDIQVKIPQYSADAILDELVSKFNAQITGTVVTKIANLPASTRLILVLKEAQRALHLAEIEAKHNSMFSDHLSVHAISATLQRLSEALIVDRGTYDLYQNMALKDEDLESVRAAVEKALKVRNSFLSTKILFREILPEISSELAIQISPYMVLGICQDDQRFDCRRGLMIGLNEPEFQGEFEYLDDTIEKIVRERGPISVAKIRNLISASREVLDTSVAFSLSKNSDIVATDRGSFDLIERVLGDEERVSNLLMAIRVALLPGETTFPVLLLRLESVGFDLTLPTLVSLLQNASFINRNGKVVNLDIIDEELAEYENKFQTIASVQKVKMLDVKTFEPFLNTMPEMQLLNWDSRLKLPRDEWDNNRLETEENNNLITDILMEFE